MNANLMLTCGHVRSDFFSSVTARWCNATISLSLASPVRKDMRTRKLTRISSMAGVGEKSSTSAADAALSLSDLPSPMSMSSTSAMSASPFSADSGRMGSSFLLPRVDRFFGASSSSSSSSSSSLAVALPSAPLVRFDERVSASRPRLDPARGDFLGCSPSPSSSSSSSSSPSPFSAASALSRLRRSSHCRMSSTSLIESTLFSVGEEEGRPSRESELTICGTNCARLGKNSDSCV